MTYPEILDLLQQVELPFVTASGTNTYTATVAGYEAHRIGQPLIVRFSSANTGASTLNINGLGAVNIHRDTSVALRTGEITANSMHVLVHDGTRFQILSLLSRLTAGKLQGQVNARLQLSSPLTGFFVGSNTAVSASTSVLNAFSQLQGQVNARANNRRAISIDVLNSTANTDAYVGHLGITRSTGTTSIDTTVDVNSAHTLQEALSRFVTLASPITGVTRTTATTSISVAYA